MKYRSITLNGDSRFRLVKYDESYKEYLDTLRKMNSSLVDSVERCPKIYSELSEHQSYMIFYGNDSCVGAIYIGTSCDEKNLEFKIEFDEEQFEDKNSIFYVIEQVVSSLGLYFYDKENIEIHLINNIDLSNFNGFKYKKQVYSENKTTYICSNKLNSILLPKLIDEIIRTEKCLIDWNQCWTESFDTVDCSSFDYELLKEYDNHTIPVSEVFNKSELLSWKSINSMKSKRYINFNRNGQIKFVKEAKTPDGIDYTFGYNILRNGFNFAGLLNHNLLEIDNNSICTYIKSGNLNILYQKEDKIKKVNYVSKIVGRSSIAIELYVNDNAEVERCYVDFRTHKGHGKINGIYALRILPQHDKYTLNFISRKGTKHDDFCYVLAENDEELFSTTLCGKITIELVDELIKKFISIINNRVSNTDKQIIALENDCIINEFIDTEIQAIDFIKQIKGEIPLPYLQENLEKFVDEYDIKKSKGYQKQKKKNGSLSSSVGGTKN